MTRKSSNRRAKDAAAQQAAGGKPQSARVIREKTTRAWYELKIVHSRTQSYIEELAKRMIQYAHPVVLLKIAKNGDTERFNELQKLIQEKAVVTGADFASLWDLHKDKNKLCLSVTELEQAYRIFDMYQAFDTDFFTTYQPIIEELNAIFNKALKQLLDAKDDLAKTTTEQAQAKMVDVNVVSDVDFTEIKPEAELPATIADLDVPVEIADKVAERGQTSFSSPIDEVGVAEVANAEGGADVGGVKTGFDRTYAEGDAGAIMESAAAEEVQVDPAMG
ncbi:MAG TPA: hypothetical protein VF905_09425, partial [Nitrospirota bacterium]